jgi:hypothetical protein
MSYSLYEKLACGWHFAPEVAGLFGSIPPSCPSFHEFLQHDLLLNVSVWQHGSHHVVVLTANFSFQSLLFSFVLLQLSQHSPLMKKTFPCLMIPSRHNRTAGGILEGDVHQVAHNAILAAEAENRLCLCHVSLLLKGISSPQDLESPFLSLFSGVLISHHPP